MLLDECMEDNQRKYIRYLPITVKMLRRENKVYEYLEDN